MVRGPTSAIFKLLYVNFCPSLATGEKCKLIKNCHFWTYLPHEFKCYVKVSDNGVRHLDGVYSGNRDCPTPSIPKEKVNVSQVSQDEVVEPDCPLYNTDLDGNDINDGIQNVESWSDCGERTYKCYFLNYCMPVFGYR